MRSEWKDTTIAEFCRFTYGKSLPARNRNGSGSVPVYGSGGLSGQHDDSLVESAGIIIGRKGTVGSVIYSSRPFWPIDTVFYVTNEKHRDLKFTYYLLKTLGLEHMNADSAVPGLNRDEAHGIVFSAPPLPEQKAIAHILGTLDDKIELNRRMNATLEGMAQALFKSWFVDFDPVIDNALAAGNPIPDELAPRAEVRRQALANGTTQQGSLDHPTLSDPKSLFPAGYQFTEEQGWIPEGWEVSSLEALATPKRGKTITKKTVNEGDIPVVAGGLQPAYFHNASNVIGPAITVSASGANAGYVNLYHEDIWASDCSYISSVDTEYFYSTLLFLKFKQDRITHMQQGAAQPHVYPKDLLRLTLAIPHEHLLEAFEKLVKPSFEKMSESDKEIQTLTKLRDTLLPKLISGELRLPEAEQLTEMAQA